MTAHTKPLSWWRKSKIQTSNTSTAAQPEALRPALTEEKNDGEIQKRLGTPTVTHEGRWNTIPNNDIRDPKTLVTTTNQEY